MILHLITFKPICGTDHIKSFGPALPLKHTCQWHSGAFDLFMIYSTEASCSHLL